MRDATAVLATILLLAAPAKAELLEFDASLTIESLESLFAPAPGFNAAFGTLAPGHGVASVNALGDITGFPAISGLSGMVQVGDIGTDAIFDFWEIDVAGVGASSFSGAPLHGPLGLLLGDARRIVFPGMTLTTLTWFHTRNGTLGPGLGGTFTTPLTPSGSVRVEFGTWTTGSLSLANLTPVLTGYTSPTVAGFDARSAGGLGMLQLVTPILVTSSTPSQRHGAFGVLRLEFVPEPARAVLLASGAGLLLVLGRRRSAKARR